MNTQSLAAALMIAAGILGLANGGFEYSRTRHRVDIGSLEFSIQEKQSVNVSLWAGLALLLAGGGLLVSSKSGDL